MKPIWVRPMQKEDVEQFIDWSAANSAQNQFDPDVLNYRQTVVLCALDDKPLIFMPTQVACVLESIAPRPESTRLQRAAALRELVRGAILLSKQAGMGELYFISRDPGIINLAKRQGFEEAPGTVLRLKIDRLEKSNENHNSH